MGAYDATLALLVIFLRTIVVSGYPRIREPKLDKFSTRCCNKRIDGLLRKKRGVVVNTIPKYFTTQVIRKEYPPALSLCSGSFFFSHAFGMRVPFGSGEDSTD